LFQIEALRETGGLFFDLNKTVSAGPTARMLISKTYKQRFYLIVLLFAGVFDKTAKH